LNRSLELWLTFGPGSQVTGIASSAVLACHQVSAMTAMPLAAPIPFIGTAAMTPDRFRIDSKSKLLSVPPWVGDCFVAA
jgi:hypothetical protein